MAPAPVILPPAPIAAPLQPPARASRPQTVTMVVPQVGTSAVESHARSARPLTTIQIPKPQKRLPAAWESMDFKLPASLWLNTLYTQVARHVRRPVSTGRGAASHHPCFPILNSPRELVRLKCEQAGLELQPQLCTNKNGTRKTVWKGLGPMSAYNFCQTNRMKKLGQVWFFFMARYATRSVPGGVPLYEYAPGVTC